MRSKSKKAGIILVLGIVAVFGSFAYFSKSSLANDVKLTVHTRGVSRSKITLYPLSGPTALKPLKVADIQKSGESATFVIDKEYLPGEFVLRFDYNQNMQDKAYPCEKLILLNKQNLELWVHPAYCNHPDSAYFQDNEMENTIYMQFQKENMERRKMTSLLQEFLLNYDDPNSDFYQHGIAEYEKRRKEYNTWLAAQREEYKHLFAGSSFVFHGIPAIQWKGSDTERKQSLLQNYFETIDFNDTMLLHTSGLQKWMDSYVNLHMELMANAGQRDSLLVLAGNHAIEEAKKAHPKMYGWMVDYFFNGYESFNLEAGMIMLAPYLNDPRCLTKKRLAIQKRLEGIKSLVPGTLAPDFSFSNTNGAPVSFREFSTTAKFKLVLFWSADCEHCMEMVDKLYPWQQNEDIKPLIEVFAISLDESQTEIPKWELAKQRLGNWRHILAIGGVNSMEANKYFVLSTPVMVLVDSKTNEIIGIPDSFNKLVKLVKKGK